MEGIPKLNKKYIEGAKNAAFRETNVDWIIESYELAAKELNSKIKVDKQKKLEKLAALYNEYLHQASNYVHWAVAGRSNHKKQSAKGVDKALGSIAKYIAELSREVERVDREENAEKYLEEQKAKEISKAVKNIAYYKEINKTLFYKELTNLHNLDKRKFRTAYEALAERGYINKNSKPGLLYKNLVAKEGD